MTQIVSTLLPFVNGMDIIHTTGIDWHAGVSYTQFTITYFVMFSMIFYGNKKLIWETVKQEN